MFQDKYDIYQKRKDDVIVRFNNGKIFNKLHFKNIKKY